MSAEAIEAIVIGRGAVGSEAVSQNRLDWLAHELGASAIDLTHTVRHTGLYGPDGVSLLTSDTEAWRDLTPDLVLAAPPSDIGEQTYTYIDHYLGDDPDDLDGPVVVTAEKGAIWLHWDDLDPFIDKRLGIAATVGGGTQVLRSAKEQLQGGPVQRIDIVPNATLGKAMDMLQDGEPSGTIAATLLLMKYAEPQATTLQEIFQSELGDVAKKAMIFFNYVIARDGEQIDSDYIGSPVLTDDEFNLLRNKDSKRRMVVTYVRTDEDDEQDEDRIAFAKKTMPGGWTLKMGFMNVGDDPQLERRLKLVSVDAGYVIRGGSSNEEDGIYRAAGPGAGVEATARAMQADSNRLLSRRLRRRNSGLLITQ